MYINYLQSAAASCLACLFSNPLEVIKTRFKLQGELQKISSEKKLYTNIFQAASKILTDEGLLNIHYKNKKIKNI